MNSLRHKSLLCFTERVHVVPVDPQHIVAFPMEILKVNLQTVSAESLKESLCEVSLLLCESIIDKCYESHFKMAGGFRDGRMT